LSPEADVLGRLAASVADGTPVDWSHAESDAAPRERRLVRHLRLVESIASLYRSIPDLDETAPDDVPSGPRWGRLVMLDRIGQGMSCEVHRAFDTDLHRHVALKLLHEDGHAARTAHERILQEARRLARVRHPHVVQVLGAEQHDDRVGLWMELVEGESLDRIVKTRGTFGAREASGVGQDVCSALAAVHAVGLLHRDVKAQNVMREEGGRIVVMDFGTGEELRRGGGTARLVGTPLYLAPEILEGKAASIQSDLYSVGVLLFYLVTREFPVAATSILQLSAAHSQGQRRRLRDVRPDLPSGFVQVIDRALDHDPAARFQSAGEMEAALRDVPGSFQPPTLVETSTSPGVNRRPIVAGAIAAMLVVVAGLLAWRLIATPPAAPAGFTRIAVLPMKDLSATPTPYLADALTDQLIATLGQVQSLRVTAAGSVARSKNSPSGVEEIARQLGVDALVETSVTSEQAGPAAPLRARVDTRVVKAGSAAPLWTGSIEWMAGDNHALQAGLTRAIAKAVNAVVTPGEAGRLDSPRQTNPNAEEAYLRGRAELTGYGSEAARRAVEAFQRALSFDAQHGGAYAGLSRAYVTLGQFGVISEAEARQSALAAARAAAGQGDEFAEAHRALADLSFFFDWDWVTAEREYVKTLALNPSFSRARMTYAELLAVLRRFPEAFKQAEIAQTLDPQSAEVNSSSAMILLYAGRSREAKALVDTALLDQPGSGSLLVVRARVAEAEGKYGEAIEFVDRAAALWGGGGVPLQVGRLQCLARAGQTAEARLGLATLEEQAETRKIRLSHRDRAYIKLALGDETGAYDEFEKSFAERESTLRWISVDPRLDQLRSNPRFQAILKRMGLS
jgi:TolB-like protein/tetratricopeptide (TPR) repeat protein